MSYALKMDMGVEAYLARVTLTRRRARGTLRGTMFGLGLSEVLVILLIIVVIFGARRLPEVGAGLGRAIKNFKTGVSGKDEIDVTPKKEEVTEGKGRS